MKLSKDEIFEVIQTCARFNVTEFALDGLSFKIASSEQQLPSLPQAIGNAEAIEKEYVAEQEVLHKEQQISEMLLNDPEQYEKLIEQGELGNAEQKD